MGGVFGHAVLLRVRRGSRRLGFFRFRKLARLHGPKPWHESFAGLYLIEIKCTPTKSHVETTGARGSAGQRTPQPQHLG